MISREEVERLAALKSGHGILTAYVRLDPRLRFVRRQAVTQFKSALQHARSRVPERWQAALERESARVVGFLTDWEPAGRGIVIFSCTPENLWEVRTLDVLVPNLIDLDTTTKTGLLEQLLEETPDTLVLVLQRDRARLYSIQQGRAGGRLDVVSDVPGQHDQGGWAQPRFQRHIEFHFEQHLEKVVDAIKKLAGNEPVKLILGGTEETVSALFNVLPEALAKTVIGTFAVDVKHDTEAATLERAARVWRDHERLEEERLVNMVSDLAKSGQRGVIGIEPTLNALAQKKIQKLLLIDGLTINGSVCTACGHVSSEQWDKCPICGGEAEQREITDRVVENAILNGAETEMVESNSARERLLREGGLGALLRY